MKKHEAKLLFNSFEFHNSKDNVYVECNATFCQKYYTTPACHTKRQIIDPVWIFWKRRIGVMKNNAYKRSDLKKKLNRLSMKISSKLFNGDHIDDVMVNVTQRRL
jgi:hypothetical protein